MKVHLRKRKMRLKEGTSKPRYSLYLDIYYRKGKRKREFLGIYLEPNDDKTYRNEKLKLAENIKAKRMMELANEEHGFPTKEKLNQNFIAYFEKQMNKREGNSRTAWLNTFRHLNDFCKGTALFTEIDREWLEEFIDYLHTKVSPSSVSTYFAKVKCALSESVKDKILIQNPSFFIDPIRVPESSREYLTIEEIQRINDVDFHHDVVKRGFLFSCFTGLRYGDIASLKWSQIQEVDFNGSGKSFAIHKRQAKTGNINHIPLNETALKLIGDRQANEALVFNLKFNVVHIRRLLQKLLDAAKISKKITFHCARHTYAVLLLANGANLMTVKELLGHRDIKSTQIYAKVIDDSKVSAVKSLPSIQ
ncbi:MAG: site-specific integrase [Bacteroidota bacterium]